MNIADNVLRYRELRNEVSILNDKIKEIKEELKEIEYSILEDCKALGVDSFKTPYGTAYLNTKTYATLVDKDLRIKYAQETGDFGLFTNHVNKTYAKEMLELVNLRDLGIDWTEELAVNFRAPSK